MHEEVEAVDGSSGSSSGSQVLTVPCLPLKEARIRQAFPGEPPKLGC
jgi:hypothetical protein